MAGSIAGIGFACGLAACAAALAFDTVQLLQVAGALRFPFDEIWIYGTSLCIVLPLIFEILALHRLTAREKRFWTQAALIFLTIYAIFVIANYVVQLATVIPAKLSGRADAVRLLEQPPHSLFWDFDAMGYLSMGIAALLLVPAIGRGGFEGWVRISLLAHAATTPLIGMVYFYPAYSERLLLLALPWGFTAPLFMGMVAVLLRRRASAAAIRP